MAIARSEDSEVRDPAPRYSSTWLELREDADSAARATDLLDPLLDRLAVGGEATLTVRDLGCGTGSMGRWLAPRLPGPQHWILQDRDPDLLAEAVANLATMATFRNLPVTSEARHGDLTRLTAAELTGTGLITASALLDLLTRAEVAVLADVCVAAACPALLTLSVVGRVTFSPVDPLDADLGTAFNDHLRHHVDGRELLGPDGARVAAEAFTSRGATVLLRPSPWRLGPADATLIAEWLPGFVTAAGARRPDLAGAVEAYLGRRLAQAASGDLRVTVEHLDLLAVPGGER